MKRKILIIGNPVAGGSAVIKIRKAAEFLETRGHDVTLMLTQKKGDAELFAGEINKRSNEYSLVIAAGGDGTYNEIANGLIYSDIPMAILPLGTTSVLAHEIGIPYSIEKAADIALNGNIQTIHLGKITCSSGHSPLSGPHNSVSVTRCFILMAGIGFDGGTVFGINEKIKRHTGKGAYIFSGVMTFLRYNPSLLTIKFDNAPAITGYDAIISKAACYGGHYKITPEAQLREPFLYAFVTQKKGRFDLLGYVAGIVKGNPPELKNASYFKANEIEVSGPAHIQNDGDYAGTTPAKIEVVPNALKLVFGN